MVVITDRMLNEDSHTSTPDSEKVETKLRCIWAKHVAPESCASGCHSASGCSMALCIQHGAN